MLYPSVSGDAPRCSAAAALASACRTAQVTGHQTQLAVDSRTVQVSFQRLPGSFWQLNASRSVADPAVAVIFVDLTGTEPDFYIAPTKCVREDVKLHLANWLRIGADLLP
jgi:hypothetical protein